MEKLGPEEDWTWVDVEREEAEAVKNKVFIDLRVIDLKQLDSEKRPTELYKNIVENNLEQLKDFWRDNKSKEERNKYLIKLIVKESIKGGKTKRKTRKTKRKIRKTKRKTRKTKRKIRKTKRKN